MVGYLVRRLAACVIVLAVVCVFTFMIFFWFSPDPAAQICGKTCTPDRIAQIRANLGLDHVVVITRGPWTEDAVRTVGDAARAVAPIGAGGT